MVTARKIDPGFRVVPEPRILGTRSVAFGGAFLAWPYHAGVASFIQTNGGVAPGARIYGTSSGSGVASMLACGIPIATTGLELALRADRAGLGNRRTVFGSPKEFMAPHLREMDDELAANAHELADDRLFITVRTLPFPMIQRVISRFPTRDALLDVLHAAIAFPLLTVPLVHRSKHLGLCLDGGPGVPSDDRPAQKTVRVGVFTSGGGQYDIMPKRSLGVTQFLTVRDDRSRRDLFQQGQDDAADFFSR